MSNCVKCDGNWRQWSNGWCTPCVEAKRQAEYEALSPRDKFVEDVMRALPYSSIPDTDDAKYVIVMILQFANDDPISAMELLDELKEPHGE